ncbi:hypothetical protein T439DRAFT_378824 [Meredithblackwellia eburnea MCA 4105]
MASKRQGYIPSTPAVQIEAFDTHDVTGDSPTHQDDSFYSTDSHDEVEKYPPGDGRRNFLGNGNSSVHIPLLSGDESRTSAEQDLDRRTARSRNFSAPFSGYSRVRLHPIALLPACLLGVFLALSGVFGPVRTQILLKPFPVPTTPDSQVRPVDPNQPVYTVHQSGHLFIHPSAIEHSAKDNEYRQSQPVYSVRHPIHDLIANATGLWEKKLARQSKTLEQAVKEYRKRYNRLPPKGFDHWFNFAQANDVVLIDEFDNINRDLEPFWAIPVDVIRERAIDLEEAAWTFTMAVQKGEVEIIGAHKADGRAIDQAKLMNRWTRWVENVNITMSAHDGPSIMTDDRTKQRHLSAARQGKFVPDDQIDEIDEDASWWGFPLSCPEGSRLRRAYTGLELAQLPPGPSFVHDHLRTMDMCENPEWQYLHGFTAWPGMRPKLIQPLFSFAKTTMYSDILLTPLEQFWDTEPYDPEWDAKPNNRAIWIGSTTGVWFDRTTWWRSSQRVRLYFMSKDKTGTQRVRFDGMGRESPPGIESIAERRIRTDILMDRYLDFAFSGKEGQCDVEDGSCEAVKRIIDFQPGKGWNQANEYKYMLDLDGNAWSGRFHRLLSSNSAVLKSTIFPEWYSDWIQPWVHYIPVKVDYTDLFDIMAFFSGDLDGKNAHEDLAKAIARQGKEYTAKHWRYQDMEAYFFRLALEWARLTAPDRSSMDYHGPGA